MAYRAVLFDFGGVILTSPFEAFGRYESERGLPAGFIRALNATNPDTNAWARFERSEIGVAEFCDLYEAEAAAAGHRLSAREVLACLRGQVRPAMVEAIRMVKAAGLKTACLTNNYASSGTPDRGGVLALFDVMVESSKIGVRKPEVRFYEIACEMVGVRPHEAVFLDDLGVNLKPARAMGMTTIKVLDGNQAIAELEAVLGLTLCTDTSG